MSDSRTQERVSVDSLRAFIRRALASQGVPEADAQKVAALMVEADIYGHDTHGVFRLRQYLARLHDGGCNACPDVIVAHETVATALIVSWPCKRLVLPGSGGLAYVAEITPVRCHCMYDRRLKQA